MKLSFLTDEVEIDTEDGGQAKIAYLTVDPAFDPEENEIPIRKQTYEEDSVENEIFIRFHSWNSEKVHTEFDDLFHPGKKYRVTIEEL